MSKTVLKIEGMSCNHCKMAVETALHGVPGVTDAQVDLHKKEAVVEGSAPRDAMIKAVDAAGYKVVN